MKFLKFFLVFILGLFSGLVLAYFYVYRPLQLGNTLIGSRINPLSSDSSSLPSVNLKDGKISTPILMYHHVKINATPGNSVEASLDVSPSNFEDQMAYLYAKNYQIISLSDLIKNTSGRNVSITFDDGYKDVIENAYPILKKLNYKATIFLITNDIGKDGYLTWEDIRFLQKEGWSVGSHTMSHPNLTNTSTTKVQDEISLSKSTIEQKLNIQVDFFCYPSGQYNDAVVETVKEAGYKAAVTTDSGIENYISQPFILKRVRVRGTDDLATFIEKIYGRK